MGLTEMKANKMRHIHNYRSTSSIQN